MKKPKAPKLVTVAITTTITIIFWIFLTLYHVLTTKPAPSVNPELLEPITAELDIESLEKIGKTVFFEEGSFQNRPSAPNQIFNQVNSLSNTVATPSSELNNEL